MKKITFLLLILVSQSILAQKYFTRTGLTGFIASVEAFEAVEAKNNSTTVILVSETGDIASQLFISAFKFRVALMQEHFNENYMDSDTHPKATFRGKLENFNIAEISNGKEYVLKGTLTVRGVKKEIETKAKLSSSENKIRLQANFSVSPQDFEIKIPSVVRKKIAESINVSLDYELDEKK